jgi:hypothetical protein
MDINKLMPPGSVKAVKEGCTCSIEQNWHGSGYLGGLCKDDGEILYIIDICCPIHGTKHINDDNFH